MRSDAASIFWNVGRAFKFALMFCVHCFHTIPYVRSKDCWYDFFSRTKSFISARHILMSVSSASAGFSGFGSSNFTPVAIVRATSSPSLNSIRTWFTISSIVVLYKSVCFGWPQSIWPSKPSPWLLLLLAFSATTRVPALDGCLLGPVHLPPPPCDPPCPPCLGVLALFVFSVIY